MTGSDTGSLLLLALALGAIGAALWGAFRHRKLKELQDRIAA